MPLSALPPREACDHLPFYCEENVARLLGRKELAPRRAWALLVTTASMRLPMRAQRAGRGPEGLVVWDYHVIALLEEAPGSPWLAADLDSLLPFPSPADLWLEASFPSEVAAELRPRFRLLAAADYLRTLSSDRSHMRGPDGSWTAPPPPWPCFGEGRPNNLFELLDLSRGEPGSLLGLGELAGLCAGDTGGRA